MVQCHGDCPAASAVVSHPTKDVPPPKKSAGVVMKDRGWSWVVLVASFLLQTVSIGVCLSSGLFIVEFMEIFETGRSETSWIASMQLGVAYLIGAPLSGPISQKISHRFSIILGSLILSGGMLLSAFAWNIVLLYVLCGLMAGIGVGLIYGPSIGIIGHYFDKRLAMAIGVTMAGGGCGSMLFSQVFYFLISVCGWRAALMLSAGIVLNCCVLGALMFPHVASKPSPADSPKSTNNLSNVPRKTRHRNGWSSCAQDISLLKDIHFVLFFINNFLVCYGTLAVFILLADYAMSCGTNPKYAALLLSITGLQSTIGRFTMAGLMHCLVSLKVVYLYSLSVLFCGLAILMMPFGSTFVSLAVLCSVFGFCYGGCCSSSPVVTAQFFGVDRLSTVYGYTLIACGLGCLLGPPVTGWIYSASSNYQLSMLLNGAVIVLSFIILVPLYFLPYC